MGGFGDRCGDELRRIFYDLVVGDGKSGGAGGMVDVSLHLPRGEFDGVCEHRRVGDLREELPGEERRGFGDFERVCGIERRDFDAVLSRDLWR